MGLPTPVNFRNSQPNATAMLAAAPQKADMARDQERFERHLDDKGPRDTQAADRRAEARANRRERDRTTDDHADRNRTDETQKAESDTVAQTDTETATADTEDAMSALVTAATAEDDTSKDLTAETADTSAEADATPVVEAQIELTTKTDTDKDKDVELGAVTPKDLDAKASVADDTAAKTDPEAAEAAALNVAATTHHTDVRKADVKAPKAEQKPATTPVPASLTPLVAAANNAPTGEAPKAEATSTDPDAGLTITGKEGLGHEAAAKMADKSDTKASAAQQPNPATQPQNAATNSPAQNFAKMLASATGGEITSVTSTSTSAGAPASLSDLQNVSSSSQSQSSSTATVRIGTLPGQNTPTQVPAMAIALQVARNLQKGVNRFDIRLDPAEMGRIDVRMEVKKNGTVEAHLTVERPETLDLLRRDATALQQALNDAGLQADADSLNFSLRDDNANNAQDFAGNLPGGSNTGKPDTASDETVSSPIYNVNLSANGGIDIRV
ncbi:MAG: flagellar hook-length control protein FliK [Parvibaculum sp.]|nr:flagellar hook-length control protein FliK [Parvibaculum sp.]